jgi:hypothetical protein
MGFSSQAGQVGFMTQASAGVFPASFGDDAAFMKLRSGALGPNRDLLITDPEIGGGRDTVDAYLGAASWSGDYEFYCRLEAITTLLKACLGSSSVSTTTGVSTHTISPIDSATLPFLAIEEAIGGSLEVMNYTDAVVNTFHLEVDANGYLMGTAGVIAKTGSAGNTKTADPVWDNSPMIVGTNVQVTLNAVSLPAKSFSIDINNNFEDDDFRLGSLSLGDLTAKAREVSGAFTIRPTDSALWRRAALGTPTATEVGGLTTKDQLVFTANTYEDIVGGTPATKGQLGFTIPKIALEPFALEQSGDDVIENDVSWRALRPDPATNILTATVKSANDTVA